MCNKPQEVKAEPPLPAPPAQGRVFDNRQPDSLVFLFNLIHAHHKPRSSSTTEFYHHSFALLTSNPEYQDINTSNHSGVNLLHKLHLKTNQRFEKIPTLIAT